MLPDFYTKHGRQEPTNPWTYSWKTFPLGVKKVAPSKMDAILEVIAIECGYTKRGPLFEMLGLDGSALSHHRTERRHGNIPEDWLFRAAVFSGIPYLTLCEVIDHTPNIIPHRKEVK